MPSSASCGRCGCRPRSTADRDRAVHQREPGDPSGGPRETAPAANPSGRRRTACVLQTPTESLASTANGVRASDAGCGVWLPARGGGYHHRKDARRRVVAIVMTDTTVSVRPQFTHSRSPILSVRMLIKNDGADNPRHVPGSDAALSPTPSECRDQFARSRYRQTRDLPLSR